MASNLTLTESLALNDMLFERDGAIFDVPYADDEPFFDEEAEWEKVQDYKLWLRDGWQPDWAF